MNIKSVLFAVCVCMLFSCSSPGAYDLANASFDLKSFRDSSGRTSLLDTNAVYLWQGVHYNPGTKAEEPVYVFIRFFSNGRAYISRSFAPLPPTQVDFNTIDSSHANRHNTGQKCYYTITSDGTIKMEVYMFAMIGYVWQYARIEAHRLSFFKEEPRSAVGGSRDYDREYDKLSVALTPVRVDW